MISITIDDQSNFGQEIIRRAKAAGISPLALMHGLAYEAFSTRAARPTPIAAAPTPAPVIPDRTETERRLGAID